MKVLWIFLLCWNFILLPVDGLVCFESRRYSSCVSFTQRVRETFFKTVCYAKVGCFYSGPPFYHLIHRPLTSPPQSPDVIRPQYMLYTRRNRYSPIFLSDDDAETVWKSTYNPRAPTRIISHGYLDVPGLSHYQLRLKDAFLEASDDNVIIHDWSNGITPSYTLTSANTRVVGALMANFIHFLCHETGSHPQQFHLFGESLGAHIIGYAGERVPNLGRITGTEPAGPFFSYMPPEVRLDPTDALFVDVVHSNQGENVIDGLGTAMDVGDIDFWPWNGRVPLEHCADRLPRVALKEPPSEVGLNIIGCRHLAAVEWYIYSFNQSNCLFVGVKCRTWEEFLAGECDCGKTGNRCKIMGYFAEPPTPEEKANDYRYYSITSFKPPYCMHQYVVQVYVHNYHTQKENEYIATIIIIGFGNELKTKTKLKLQNNKKRSRFLVTSEKALHDVHSAIIKFEDSDSTNQLSLGKIEVSYLYPLFCRIFRNILDRFFWNFRIKKNRSKIHTTYTLCRKWKSEQGNYEEIFVFKNDNCHFGKHLQ